MTLQLFIIIAVMQLPQINIGSPLEGYYWRVFNGTIPSDAFEGAAGGSCGKTYIGQTLFRNFLTVGKFCETDKKIHIGCFEDEYEETQDFKILCSREQHLFRWNRIKTIDDLPLLTDRHFILGGVQELSVILYIGRLGYNSTHGIGKVYLKVPNNGYNGLNVAYDGKNVHFDKDFEVLSFFAK